MKWALTAFALWTLVACASAATANAAELPQTAAHVETPPRREAQSQRRDQAARHEGAAPAKSAAPAKPGAPGKPAAPSKPEAGARHGPGGAGRNGRRGCLSTAETREVMAAKRLTPPFLALRSASSHARGETIGVRLCRHGNDEFTYEINVLRRDGRVVKVILDAASGKIVRLINDR